MVKKLLIPTLVLISSTVMAVSSDLDVLFDYGVPPETETKCPESHPIKGNLNTTKRTMIYHKPGDKYYSRTNPERCYDNEKDARKDGFRRAEV